MSGANFAEPALIKRRRVDLEEEKSEPAVVIKTHLKRKVGESNTSGTETSDWDEKES